jgi:hypothetical protein
MQLSAPHSFRIGTLTFAVSLAAAAVWILEVEIIRPALPFFPVDTASSKAAADHRSAAGVAASIGVFRGELWTEYAMTLAPDISGAGADAMRPAAPEEFDNARAAAVRASELAPHDSRLWLLLAGMDSRRNRLNRSTTGPLKMSYYTGPSEVALIPLRISIATRSDAIADPELQILVGGEIRTIITSKPDLKPLIIAAYRNAQPDGRHFIEATVSELDPALLAALSAVRGPGR